MMVGHDSHAATRMLVPEKFDLFERGVKIIADMDDDKQRLLLWGVARKNFVGA